MARSPRLTINLPPDKMALAEAYAKDKGVPLAIIARSALMAEVTRYTNRNHNLVDAIADEIEARYPALRELGDHIPALTLSRGSQGRSASAERIRT